MLKRRWESIFPGLLVFWDIVLLDGSLLLVHLMCNLYANFRAVLLFTNFTYLLVYIVSGVYLQSYKSSLEHQLKAAGRGSVYAGVFLLLVSILMKPGREFLLAIIIFLLLQYLFVSLGKTGLFYMNKWLRRRGYGIKNTLIVSDNPAIVQKIQSHDLSSFGYAISGFVAMDRSVYYELKDGALRAIGQDNLGEILDSLGIQNVLIVDDILETSRYGEIVDVCRQKGMQIRLIPSRFDRVIRNMKLHELVGISLSSPGRSARPRSLLKRMLDVLIAGVGLITLSPFLLLVALLIKLNSRGPLLFVQPRSLNGYDKSFDFYKFRSMTADADKQKQRLGHRNITTGALFKDPKDPRITSVGRIIRKFSIDEFPQLVNVLKGDMSIVGPRPLPVEDFQRLSSEERKNRWYMYRANSVPGITGLWQVSGRSDIGFEEMVLLDVYYAENHSLLLDLEILSETLPCVICGKGSY